MSSSGHLIILPHILGWAYQGKSFDAAVHLGTLLALLIYYWRDWMNILGSFCRHIFKNEQYPKDGDGVSGRLLVPIIVACVPAAIVGVKYSEIIEDKLSNWQVVSVMLVAFGIAMFLADRFGRKQRDIASMSYGDYISIGLAQMIALVPGVSRSGITITGGLMRGLNRDAAARFSFLLSTPIVFGAGLFALKNIDISEIGMKAFVCGLASSAVFGYIAIGFLINFLKSRPVTAFMVYRICLAAALVGFALK